MPSFLSKVFGRKKEDKESSPTNQLGPGELLGGKFEAISPNVSPNAGHYLELQSDTVPLRDADSGRLFNDEKDFGLPFFRTKSRPSSPEVKPKKLFDTLPPLSLDFDLKDKSAYNGYIFEESNSEAVFPDNVLGQRRLDPMEALILIRTCSKAIISRGVFRHILRGIISPILCRTRNSRNYDATLVLCISRCSTKTHLQFPEIPRFNFLNSGRSPQFPTHYQFRRRS
jgi:hypothetical protein